MGQWLWVIGNGNKKIRARLWDIGEGKKGQWVMGN
jgi:hypothetical protein